MWTSIGTPSTLKVRTKCKLRGAGRVARTATSAGMKQTGVATTGAEADGLDEHFAHQAVDDGPRQEPQRATWVKDGGEVDSR